MGLQKSRQLAVTLFLVVLGCGPPPLCGCDFGSVVLYGKVQTDSNVAVVTSSVTGYGTPIANPCLSTTRILGEATTDGSGRFRLVIAELARSEERRVGKECRSRWSPY